MKFLILNSTDPYRNLAIEEYMFRKTEEEVFILWQNEPTVVIGKNQNANCEINLEFTSAKGIHIARRITGGGAVYHDLGNLNYSYISSSKNGGIDFASFTKPIIDALCQLGVDARLSGRNDIEVDGKKISGNAQYSTGGRTLHHGTLLFDADLSVLSNALQVDEEKIKSKAIKSTRSRVINLKSLIPIKDVNEFIDYLATVLINKYSLEVISAPECAEIDLLTARNASKEWLFPENSFLSDYTVRKKKKYDFGLVDIELCMNGEVISDIKIFGDYFGILDIFALEEKIKGSNISDVEMVLRDINVSDYILGMTSYELSEQIKKG